MTVARGAALEVMVRGRCRSLRRRSCLHCSQWRKGQTICYAVPIFAQAIHPLSNPSSKSALLLPLSLPSLSQASRHPGALYELQKAQICVQNHHETIVRRLLYHLCLRRWICNLMRRAWGAAGPGHRNNARWRRGDGVGVGGGGHG